MPCFNFVVKGKLTERKLAIILIDWYDIDDVLPPINLTDEEIYGEGQGGFSDKIKANILY